MNSMQLWQRYNEWLYYNDKIGLYLDVSRMGVTDEWIQKLQPEFDRAFKDMADLENGAIANPDEKRMVGHYWLRAPELAPAKLKNKIITTLDDIEQFVANVHNGTVFPPEASKFTDVLSIGIGGSALGPQFVDEALVADFPPMQIHFIDNTDPAGMDRVLNRLKERLKSTLVIVTSKSGSTPETRNAMLEVKRRYEQEGLYFTGHAVAITMLGSQMDELERQEGWLAEFEMFDWVGGRTSEMSSVGLLSAALMGIDIRRMLEGAREMDQATRVADVRKNPAALMALCWYQAGNGRGEKDMVVLPYKDSLLLFSRYLQQLVMESLGKEKDLNGCVVHQGIAVYGNKGSTDQHAFIQQLREGIANFFAIFIEVLQDREGFSMEVDEGVTSGDYLFGFLQGTRNALYEKGRESVTISIPQVNPHTIGALIALFERSVGFYADLVNINAYNQPGVEAGKKAAQNLLNLQQQIFATLKSDDRFWGMQELAEAINAGDEVENIYKIVRHLSLNQRGLVLKGEAGKPDLLQVRYVTSV
jgi:glucose-6-phosphate isomerase